MIGAADIDRIVEKGRGAVGVGADLAVVRAWIARRLDGEPDPAADDPALARLKAESRAAFKQAFVDAVAALDPRERSLLNLALVKGVGIDKVAVVYGIHRATAARWIAQARDNLTRAVHALLRRRL